MWRCWDHWINQLISFWLWLKLKGCLICFSHLPFSCLSGLAGRIVDVSARLHKIKPNKMVVENLFDWWRGGRIPLIYFIYSSWSSSPGRQLVAACWRYYVSPRQCFPSSRYRFWRSTSFDLHFTIVSRLLINGMDISQIVNERFSWWNLDRGNVPKRHPIKVYDYSNIPFPKAIQEWPLVLVRTSDYANYLEIMSILCSDESLASAERSDDDEMAVEGMNRLVGAPRYVNTSTPTCYGFSFSI